ncbi:MAG: hypothetical protein CMH83_11295 [Nocardioides sp.]|nr:hypothetical protein [Nocardioides sp.]
MAQTPVLYLALGVPVLALAIVGTVLAVAFRARPQHPGDTPGEPPTRWNVEIKQPGSLPPFGSQFGRLDLDEQRLLFTPDGAQQPAWSLPAYDVRVQHLGGVQLDGATLWLGWPGGSLRCEVSREHLNRFSRNTAKTLRQQGYTREVVAALVAAGAQPA